MILRDQGHQNCMIILAMAWHTKLEGTKPEYVGSQWMRPPIVVSGHIHQPKRARLSSLPKCSLEVLTGIINLLFQLVWSTHISGFCSVNVVQLEVKMC